MYMLHSVSIVHVALYYDIDLTMEPVVLVKFRRGTSNLQTELMSLPHESEWAVCLESFELKSQWLFIASRAI